MARENEYDKLFTSMADEEHGRSPYVVAVGVLENILRAEVEPTDRERVERAREVLAALERHLRRSRELDHGGPRR